MRRSLRLIIALMLVSVVIMSSMSVQAATKLEVWLPLNPKRTEAMNAMVVPKFKAMHPDVELVLYNNGFNIDKLITAIASGAAPDIAAVATDKYPALARGGQFVALDSIIARSKFNIKNIPDTVLEQFRSIDGKLYALPFDGLGINVVALYVNNDLFSAAGLKIPPVNYDDPYSGWSWDQFRQTTRRLTQDKNGDGTMDQWGLFFIPNPHGRMRIMWTFGADVLSSTPNWHSVVNSKEAIEAWEFFRTLKFVDKVMAPNQNEFQKGNLGILDSPVAYAGNEMANVTAFDWTVTAFPYGKGGRWGIAQNNPMGILSSSKNKELAFDFMQLWLSDEVQFYMSSLNLMPPQTLSSARRREFIFSDKPPYDKSPFVFGRSKAQPIGAPNYDEFLKVFTPEMDAIWNTTNEPVQTILERLHERINQVLKQ